MKIEVTVFGTATEPWEGRRDSNGDAVLEAEDWRGIVEALKELSFMERHSDDPAEVILDRFIARWEETHLPEGAHLILPTGSLNDRASSFFRALQFRGAAGLNINR